MHHSFNGSAKRLFCLMAFAFIGMSCSSKPKLELFPVRGKVLFKDKPAAGVLLTFIPTADGTGKAPRPIAMTEEDGTFSAVTNDEEGAPAGNYVVTLAWMQTPDVKKGESMPDVKKGESISMRLTNDPVDKLNGKYRDQKNGIKVTIEKGPNELKPFDLK